MGRSEVRAPKEDSEKMTKKKASKKEVSNEAEVVEVEVKEKKKKSSKEDKENRKAEVVEVKENKKKITERKLKRSLRDSRKLPNQSEFSDEEIEFGKQEQCGADDDASVSVDDAGTASDEGHPAVDESDSSEDEVAPRNTIGDVPFEWYKDEEHIGYDITGKKIKKKERQDKLEKFLASADDSKDWRKIYDEYNDEEVELTKKETKIIRRLLEGKAPHSDFDPHEPYVDWFKWEDAIHPLSNAPEPKRRFIPSKWESKKIIQLVRAIREGRIKFDEPEEEPKIYDLWGDESATSEKRRGLSYIPPPKIKAPGHAESFNPSLEYIPTEEEINAYQMMYDEDRPNFIPKSFTSMRSVPAYPNALKESMERCLDIYMCPRVQRKRLNINPDALKPKLPNPKDFKPYPVVCELEFKGHKGAIVSISVDPSGQWIASGSTDGTVRIWKIENCRCTRVWDMGEAVKQVAWNPLKQLPVLAVAVGSDVLILDTGLGNEEEKSHIDELLHSKLPSVASDTASVVTWLLDDKHEGLRLSHSKTVSSIEWHRKGDYFTTVTPSGESRSSVLIHRLSMKLTQRIPFKLHGIPVYSSFHPTLSMFLVATKRNVRIYDLVEKKTSKRLSKKLETGFREISSVAVHPRVVNLTLIDLPGLTKVAVEGQPESIVADIENMVRSYVEKPNCLILAISPANQDIATSDAIKLAREVDPAGDRTFGVLTKLDLMDKGTNALDVLEGRSYRLQHPWVGIVNRSQADINRNVDMSDARRKEKEYFAISPDYSHLSNKMGSDYLAKLLSKQLESVIRAKIPSITSLINKNIDELQSELDRLGRPIGVDAGAHMYTILELCRAFDKIFKDHLDGGRPGGDRIYGVFDNQLPAAMRKLPFDRHLSLQNVRKVVSESDGYQPHLIAPEQGYRRLIDGSLNYFRGPAEASVDAVHFVLKELVRKSLAETMELKRFPSLQAEIAAAASESLERFREESKKTVTRLVEMESSYLTVDFFRKLPLELEKAGNPTTPAMDRYTESHFRRIASNVSSYIIMVAESLKLTIPKAVVYCQVRQARQSLLNYFYVQIGKREAKQLGELLNEDPALMERRLHCAKRLELYKAARDEIDSVSWAR